MTALLSNPSPFTFAILPFVAAMVGAAVAVYRPPGVLLVSAIQHFAAGVVFAVAAGEILPQLLHSASPVATLAGGTLGVATMLLVKRLEELTKGPFGLLTAVGLDLFIDGLVLGLAFIAGAHAGMLVAIALTTEVLFLGLTVTVELNERALRPWAILGVTGALALLLPIGSLLAIPVAGLPPMAITGFFAFGLMALLYLVTEELLVAAHEVPDRPWVTAMFFAGFLVLLLLEETLG